MRRVTGKAIAIILVREVFTRFGPPEGLLTDNGSQFVSRFLRVVCKKWGVKLIHSSPYHPQGNFVERANRDFKGMLFL
jgi:transposase InsO family protein